jgi:hypothetical protein
MNRKISRNIAGRILGILMLLGALFGLTQMNVPQLLLNSVSVAYADGDCGEGSVPPQPDPDGLCGPTPTPSPTPIDH